MARKAAFYEESVPGKGARKDCDFLYCEGFKAPKTPVQRFAHPFFTTKPVAQRASVPGVGTRMTDYVEGTLLSIPDPIRNPPTMSLDEIIGKNGAAEVAASSSIIFHATGDTGHAGGGTEDMQEYVADANDKGF